MYCNREFETMPRDVMRQLQTEKLHKTIRWAFEKSSFYREQMLQAGLTDASIQTLEDLEKMPFTTKKQLSARSPYDFLTGPLSGVSRMRMIGNEEPVTRAYTARDIGRNVEMMARCLMAGGVNMTSVLQISEHYADENAMSVQYAGEALGATIIPSSVDKLDRCLEQIVKLGVTSIATTSKQILQFLVAAQALNYDLKELKVAAIFLLNRTAKNNMEDHLGNRFNAMIYNLYAPPEIGCPGMMYDCAHKSGMHFQEDYFYPEIVSLTDHRSVFDGQVGELVVTSLSLEAMPIIRYRTGQIVSLDSEVCACGRTFARIKAP